MAIFVIDTSRHFNSRQRTIREKILPHEINESALSGDFSLNSICKIDRVLALPSGHGGQVPDITDDGPRGHHEVNVGGHAVL